MKLPNFQGKLLWLKTELRKNRKICQSVDRRAWTWPCFPKHGLYPAPLSSLKHILCRYHSCPAIAVNTTSGQPSLKACLPPTLLQLRLGHWPQRQTEGVSSLTPPLSSLLWDPHDEWGQGQTSLYSTEGAAAALFWWSPVLPKMSFRADPMSGRCHRWSVLECKTCKNPTWLELYGQYSYCPQLHFL